MVKEDLIRNKLSNPEIEVGRIEEDGLGKYVYVTASMTEGKLRKLVGEDFKFDGDTLRGEDGLHAVLRLK